MTDSDAGQLSLTDAVSGGSDDGDRPDQEAQAVADDLAAGASVVDTDREGLPEADDYLDVAVTQVDYTIEGRGEDEEPIIHVFGRTPDAQDAVHVKVYGFRPYFYAPVETVSDERIAEFDGLTGYDVADDDGEPFESIRGDELARIYGRTPRDVGNVRDQFEHYEADILFPNRFLIDKDVNSGLRVPNAWTDDETAIRVHHEDVAPTDATVTPRVNTFDIEVDDRNGFPEDGDEEIVCLTSHDSYRDEYVCWLQESSTGESVTTDDIDYDPIPETMDYRVETFEAEEAMLDAYLDYVAKDTDPDVITGWNCLPADSKVLMADGTEREIQHVQVGDEVVGNDEQATTITEVTNKWESEKEILEFDLADGTSLRSSEDHRIMVGDDDQVGWKQGNELEAGEYVLKPRKLNVEDETLPELSDLVPVERQRYVDEKTVKEFKTGLPNGSVSELADRFDLATGTLYHPTTDTWTPERCTTASREYDVPLPDGGLEYQRTGAALDRPLSETEVYLAGLVLTDGTMSTGDGIRFYNTRRELHEQFPGENELTPDGTGCFKQNVLDYARLHAFNGLGIPFGDKNDGEVDLSTVYELPEAYIARFLAGVIDGDGNVSSSVTVAAENRSIGGWYAKLFRRLGIYATQRENVVRVPDAERDLKQLKARVLPHMHHSKKAAAIEELEGGKSGQSENIPYALFEAETGSDEKRIGRDKHRRGINLKRHETSVEQWEEYVFVAVEDVRKTGVETTYDIETKTHNFVAENCLVHNCDDFDAPYFLDRLDELASPSHDYDLDANRLSRVNEVWRSGWGGPDVKGRVVFDLLYAYKSRQFTELDSYRLDAVGETELDVGKERYSGDIGDLWEQDPTRLLEYNLRDVELCVELDRKQDIVAFYDEVRTFVGCKLEDAPTAGDAVDMYVLHKVNGEFALPSKGQQESEDYEGGAVFDPITGVKENVTVLDLKCFSPDTDVLTPHGSRNIAEIDEGEEIYTLNPETFECETTQVAETHEYENGFGELHHLSGNTHDFKITENHRLMHSKERGWDDQSPEDFVLEEYRNIPENERFAFPQHEPMDGERPGTFDLIEEVDDGNVVIYYGSDLREFRHRVPDAVTDELELVHGSSARMGHEKSVGKYLLSISTYRDHRESIDELAQEVFLKYAPRHRETPLSFGMRNWLELIGWYVTEGSAEPERGRFTIHQDNQACRRAISELLEEMEITHSVDERGFNVSNTYLTDWFVDNCGKGYADKQLPEWVFDFDSELLQEVLDTMIRGDGSRAASGLGKFWTKSSSLKDDFVRAAVRCGEKPTVSLQSDDTWYVSAGKRGSFEKATNATVEPDDGTVHCVTAEENHVILAGRNGNFQWIGQSLYPMCMVTVNASPETKVDPEAYDGDTFVAPNGTRFRKEPDGMIREMVDELLGERENKKALRNEHEPGSVEYETYDQQQAAVKVIMNCFASDTDVLTPDGVRNIRDLEVGEEVYSLDPDSMEMEVKPVVETHEYPEYRDEMVDIETSKVDFSVTPNHRMLVRKDDENGESWEDFQFVEAGELNESSHYELPHDWDGPDGDRLDVVDLTAILDGDYEVWCDNDVHGHTLKGEVGYYPDKMEKQGEAGTGYVFDADEFEAHREYLDEHCSTFYVHSERGRKWIPRFYDGDDFVELLAWYITEGNVYTSEDKQFGENYRGSATTVKIAQDAIETDAVADGGERDDHATIGSLLERMGFDSYVDDRAYEFTSKLLGVWLAETCGDDSFSKRIPEFVFDLATEQKRLFLNTLIAGDGDRQTNSWRYTTSSEHLRDDVLRLCTHLGLTASVNRDSGSWRIYCTKGGKNSFRMHRSGSTSTAEDGAYCVTVEDNHTLLAGRNGTFQFVGQSLYGVLGWDRFRLYDKEMGAAVTATGREVIEHTETAANEIGHEVAYGDSVTGDRPIVVRDPDEIVRIVPIEELFAKGERTHDADVLLTADGGHVASASSKKDRRSLDGWEALSMSSDGDSEWQPIRLAIRHETEKEVLKLRHKFGESTTTTDHSYIVEDDDGALVEAPPEEVEEPLRVNGLPGDDVVETVDVYDVLEGYTRTYEDGRSVGAENAETKVKRIHANDEWVWFGHEHHDGQNRTVRVKREVDLTSEAGESLVRLLAAYIAEGSASTEETTTAKFGASISESRREWLTGLQEDYYRLFDGVTANVIESDTKTERTVEYDTDSGGSESTYDDTTLKLQMMNELAAVFFREFAGQTSRGKRIPSFVFQLPEDLQDLFVQVLVEGDGSREFPRYSEEYAERNFDYETASRELAGGLSMLLTDRGEKHSLKYRDSKDSYTIRTCDCYRSGRDPVLSEVDHDGYVYDLSVAENENFVDAVGCILLHNTDSVMLELGGDVSTEEAIETSFDIEEHINASYDDFASEELDAYSHRFQIEFEKLYRRFFQAGKKKRYAGHIVWKEGNDVDDVDITGFEYKRSDIAPVTKVVQREVIERIVYGEDLENIRSYVSGVIDDFLAGEYSYDEIGIPGGIGKKLDAYETDTAQVRGAKYANTLFGTNFSSGSKPKRLYLESVHPSFFEDVEDERGLDPREDPLYGEFKRDPDVICFEYDDQIPEAFDVDYEKMLDKTVKGPIERVIEALGMSWDEVKTGQEQTGLGSFM